VKSIDTLIKLHKRELDELRKQMVSLENQKAQLQLLSAKLAADLEDEIRKAKEQPELSQFFGGFAKRIQKRQEEIAGEVKALDKKNRGADR